jgi:isoleucyl-tRNA synthetase
VTGALEIERQEKRIGASLEAAPVVHVADEATRSLLASVPFADICIVSDLCLSDAAEPAGAFTLDDVAGIAVEFAPASGEKCARCWRILPDVGSHRHAQVCQRCDDALG